jgi:GNAT superfamily N-acetyltransferase
MNIHVVLSQSEATCKEIDSFLDDRIYEFNARATGYSDGKLLAGCVRDAHGDVNAGFSGHTWGGCCELSYVWVHERYQGQSVGRRLLEAAEGEARSRECKQVVLATHSFQAPGFYERLGYERKFVLEGVPLGHQKVIYVKRLQEEWCVSSKSGAVMEVEVTIQNLDGARTFQGSPADSQIVFERNGKKELLHGRISSFRSYCLSLALVSGWWGRLGPACASSHAGHHWRGERVHR